MSPLNIVEKLLERTNWVRALVGEASIHLPRRGKIWVASFTGVHGQQWRTTGTTNQVLAMARAREFELAARAERKSAMTAKPKAGRLRQSVNHDRGLTQREVGWLLHLSERAVRAIEQRALRKLAQHPELRKLWQEFLASELTEQNQRLSELEIKALVGLTRCRDERNALRKVLALIGQSE